MTLTHHRVGYRMAAVRAYVEAHPGCSALAVARHVAPHGNGIGWGYASVHRAIRAGLVWRIRCADGRGRMQLWPRQGCAHTLTVRRRRGAIVCLGCGASW